MSAKPIYATRTIKRRRRTKADIAHIREVIYEVLYVENPMTVRQVFYRLVSPGVIDKKESEYKGTVCRLLVRMRKDHQIPFEWISDNTRWMRKPRTYSSMEDALRDTARTYRRALWDDQEVHVEIWCEKDALAGVILEETYPWDVPLMVARGYSSQTYLYETAQNLLAINKPAYIYHFGDCDPSGEDIPRFIERTLREYASGVEIHYIRAALNPEQIEAFNLPTRPTKKSDSRSKKFKGESVDLDALPSSVLRELVRECIERHIDAEALKRTKEIERAERETMQRIMSAWLTDEVEE